MAPFSKRTSLRHQITFTAHGSSHGSGTTSDWSECTNIDALPGRAMFAVKLLTM